MRHRTGCTRARAPWQRQTRPPRQPHCGMQYHPTLLRISSASRPRCRSCRCTQAKPCCCCCYHRPRHPTHHHSWRRSRPPPRKSCCCCCLSLSCRCCCVRWSRLSKHGGCFCRLQGKLRRQQSCHRHALPRLQRREPTLPPPTPAPLPGAGGAHRQQTMRSQPSANGLRSATRAQPRPASTPHAAARCRPSWGRPEVLVQEQQERQQQQQQQRQPLQPRALQPRSCGRLACAAACEPGAVRQAPQRHRRLNRQPQVRCSGRNARRRHLQHCSERQRQRSCRQRFHAAAAASRASARRRPVRRPSCSCQHLSAERRRCRCRQPRSATATSVRPQRTRQRGRAASPGSAPPAPGAADKLPATAPQRLSCQWSCHRCRLALEPGRACPQQPPTTPGAQIRRPPTERRGV